MTQGRPQGKDPRVDEHDRARPPRAACRREGRGTCRAGSRCPLRRARYPSTKSEQRRHEEHENAAAQIRSSSPYERTRKNGTRKMRATVIALGEVHGRERTRVTV